MAQSRPPAAALAVIGSESLDRSWKVIGAGGFGQVFKTRHVQWRWDVAIKLLCLDNGSFSDKDLLGEAEMMRRAESPYVIRVLGVFRGSRPSSDFIHVGLVMELMERGSLESLQNKLEGLPPWSLVFRLVHHVALGMNYLHGLTPPMIHRDLKPGNVLLDSGLNAKITDFGLAKFVTNVTSTRLKGAGTPFFMPPEAFSPFYTTQCSFDVYSFAVLLWSVLNTDHSVAAFNVQRGGRPPLDVVKGLKAPGLKEMINLMERCWNQNPDRRPTFTECTAETEGLYEKHQRGINDAVYQVQKKLDADGSPKDAQRGQVRDLRADKPKPASPKKLPDQQMRDLRAAFEKLQPAPPKQHPVRAVIPGSTDRRDFLQFSSPLSFDPNTANRNLILSKNNRRVTYKTRDQHYADHPRRFTRHANVLSNECLSEPRYFEVQWSGDLFGVAVSQDDVDREDKRLSLLGYTVQSGMLWYFDYDKRYWFTHNNINTEVSGPVLSTRGGRVGVYVDPSAGVLCFYDVSGDTMSLLHTERITFTPPLYAGLWVGGGATAEVCKIW